MDFEVKTFKNDKFEMKYTKIGDGKRNFVMIPGMSLRPIFLSAQTLALNYADFKDYTIYCFDRKENMNEDYSIEDRADDVMEVCNALGLKDLYVCGVSLGGFMAQYIGFKYPKLVKKIVIASSSYYLNESGEAFMDKVIELGNQKDVRGLASYSIRQIYSKEFNDKYRDTLVKSFENIPDYEINQYKMDAIALKRADYLLNDITKIEAKTLIVASKLDKIFGYEPSLLMSLKIKDNLCVLYDEYSHAVYDEAPDFRGRLKEFFDK